MKHLAKSVASLAAATFIMHTCPAFAQDWPVRPLKIVISQAPGAAPDILARILSERLGRKFGQPVVVENRPGGGNIIGAQSAARATPDGYTYFMATAAPLVLNPYTFKTLPYDPVQDFTPVGMIGGSQFFLAVSKTSSVHNLDDLLALARKNPDRLSFSSDGPKGFAGLMGEWINQVANTKMIQVPYTSATQGLQEVLAGRNTFTIQAAPVVLPYLASGDLKAIAITSTKQAADHAVKPVTDSLPGIEMWGWIALMTQAKVDPKIIKRFNAALDEVLREPDMVKRLSDLGMETDGAGTPDEAKRYIAAEHAKWGLVTRQLQIAPD